MSPIELLKLWVDALESGEYTQVKNRLHTSEGYCVYGVLCDLYHNNVAPFTKVALIDAGCMSYDGYTSVVPQKIQDFLGPTIMGCLFRRHLIDKNDSGVCDFPKLANIIREVIEECSH